MYLDTRYVDDNLSLIRSFVGCNRQFPVIDPAYPLSGRPSYSHHTFISRHQGEPLSGSKSANYQPVFNATSIIEVI